MATLADLVAPPTKAEVEQTILDLLEGAGFTPTAWQPGSFPLTIVSVFAELFADAFYAIAQIANGGVFGLSVGRWVDLWLESQYDEERLDPVFTIGQMQLADTGNTGPHVISALSLVVTTSSGLQFRNITGGTLLLGGTLDLTWRATVAGAAYNIPNNTTLSFVTSLPGVTVTNPSVGSTGTWITTLGADVEADAAAKTRGSSKWGTVSTGSPPSAYRYWALSQTGVTRVRVDDGNPDGPGSVRVYIDNAGAVAALQAILQPASNDGKVPTGTLLTVMAATTQAVTIQGTVTVDASARSAAESAILANLTALALRIPIGGKVIRAQVMEEIMSALPDDDNVSNFVFGSSTSADVQLAASAIPQFTLTLTYVEA